jgi:hypothetical protein
VRADVTAGHVMDLESRFGVSTAARLSRRPEVPPAPVCSFHDRMAGLVLFRVLAGGC